MYMYISDKDVASYVDGTHMVNDYMYLILRDVKASILEDSLDCQDFVSKQLVGMRLHCVSK